MELTKAEEKIMQVLWRMERGFVKDIIAQLDEDPKPAYTTVSTIIRILEQKGFVSYKAYGKTYEYFPLISREDYRKKSFGQLLTGYFDGKPAELLSYLVREQALSLKDIQDMENLIASSEKKSKK
jgi:BlaI family transcriptional regulator, penicillinase repressor